ncbi:MULTISPECIES: NADH-quinone oxidoreductase subunit G [Gordonia]|uniref:NADH-quinone oxidoreductase n=3 Tax=Gordonia sihwensis TaxID=173559 RepID=L7LM47_9ACTN|nr:MULTISPECIES: NADH-quinone oxidoreductase subunit G [Gordonia]AUH69393.1 NADH-quinone oxidoreductase subunit G [Gordonia sp. YC-JH1]WFN94284.1 NADH-quinone oxidoreductase subunit G [Gordonia sihwensis]GAC61172.1 NADH-quinone oxidoreductase chain G [Gordonia sihwensis NBRC 108236]
MTAAATDLITLTIDDVEVSVPKGTLVIRAAELIGVAIPRFCDHPLLAPAGACRQCLVDVEGQRKPMASCTIVATEGMVVRTQLTSADARRAQEGVMELLLINHPLDCPTCDKGGECPLQNQAMSAGRPQSRYGGVKRTFTKPVPLSSEVLLDRERCVLCARCTRFSNEIAGDPLIELAERGALQQVSAYADEPFESYFSGNTVQICPVGALTGTAYRFRSRPFDLISSPSVCEHCAAGCAQRTDHRRGEVLRRLAGDDPEVNEEWNCDKGRWAFTYTSRPDRITTPLVRGDDGELHPAPWSYALAAAARGLSAAGSRTGVLVGGRATVEDAYAYGKFARVALGTNDVDFRIRTHSAEEDDFLSAHVAGSGIGLTYAELEQASTVVLAGLEPEEECPILFLRLRKAVRRHGQAVHTVAPWTSPGAAKLGGSVLQCVPGREAAVLRGPRVHELLSAPGAALLIGERLAGCPGALTAAAEVAAATGARLAWVPRRAGERGALDVGAAPNLLPAGRPLSSERARRDVAAIWGVQPQAAPGRDTAHILSALTTGDLSAALVGGVELGDLPSPSAGDAALAAAGFVVSLELRRSSVTAHADVVLPVAAVAEKPGTFVDWEGRPRPFDVALPPAQSNGAALPLSDHRVLHALGREMGFDLRCDDPGTIHREFAEIGGWTGERHRPAPGPAAERGEPPAPEAGQAVLASWRMLLDFGRMQDGEPHLAGTARPATVRLSAATAAEIGAADGERVVVSTDHGAIALPLTVTDLPDRVVWLPMNSPGSRVCPILEAEPGAIVTIGRDDHA